MWILQGSGHSYVKGENTKGNSHKKAQKSQRQFDFLFLCLFVAIPFIF